MSFGVAEILIFAQTSPTSRRVGFLRRGQRGRNEWSRMILAHWVQKKPKCQVLCDKWSRSRR